MNPADPTMNPSPPEPIEALINGFIEGNLDEAGHARLIAWLALDPANAGKLRGDLAFADLLEQTLIAHRSRPAFIDGLQTRFHAEATADEFLEDLLPRLREVDERLCGIPSFQPRVIRFPVRWSVGIGLAAAAALTVAALFGFSRNPVVPANSRGVAKLTQTSSDIVWSGPDGKPGSIEWELGSAIPAGASIRLESGTAKLDLADGGILTLEGPADLQLESPSEARLVKGNVLATVSPGVTPVTIHAPGMHFEVDGSTTGVRTLDGDKLEASVLSETGKVTAMAGENTESKKAIGPKEALLTHAEEGLKELVPVDPATYRNHFNLLAGITSHSPEVAVEIPEQQLPSTRAPIVVALENDRVETKSPVPVDITPSHALPLSHTRNLSLPNRPALTAGTKMRAYVVDVGPLPLDPKKNQAEEAFIQFDKRILGIAATPDTMNNSDAVVGPQPADANPLRGLPEGDALSIGADGRTLRIRLKEGDRRSLASFRVFVQDQAISAPGPATGTAWATPRVLPRESPDLTGKDPDGRAPTKPVPPPKPQPGFRPLPLPLKN